MKTVLKVGLIGTGVISKVHATNILKTPSVELKSVVDVDKKRAEIARRAYYAKFAFDDYMKVLEDPDIDFVIVATPPSTHAEIVINAIKAGKHVLVEKPIASSLEDADEIIKVSSKSDVKVMLAENERFNIIYTSAYKMLKAGKIGNPFFIRANRRSCCVWWKEPELTSNNWFWDHEKGGGPIVEQCIHEIHLSRWFFSDEAIRVYSEGNSFVKKIKCGDTAVIVIRFSKGGIAVIDTTFAMPDAHPFDKEIEILGTRGFLEMSNLRSSLIIHSSEGGVSQFMEDNITSVNLEELKDDMWLKLIKKSGKTRVPIDFGENHINELTYFIDCIKNDKEPVVSVRDGRRDLEIALAAHLSINLHKPIDLPLNSYI